jgi:hypothetical protein
VRARFYCRKNKPEVTFNALTQIKLKKMTLTQPTQPEEIQIKWIRGTETGKEEKPEK